VALVIIVHWRPIVFNIMNIIVPPYDPNFYEQYYEVEDGVIYVLDLDRGARYPVLRIFSDGFENAATIRDLVGPGNGWTQLTLQSPQASSVSDYNRLAQQILGGEGDFLDNRIEPSAEQAHTGQQSLRAAAVAHDGGSCCSKASLHTLLLHYLKGDDVWFSAWYYLEEPVEFITIMDLETSYVRGWPGMRVRLHHGYLELELAKWEPNVVYRQPESQRIPFPTGEWVHVEAHLLLSEDREGVIQLWQNDVLIINQSGQTLPFENAVYDSLEIGLTAFSHGSDTIVLYVDDLRISADPME
jgi:hypothetical protein